MKHSKPVPKLGTSLNGRPMHYTVGAIIEIDDKHLLLDRAVPPLGYAGIAGHIDEGETPEEALVREVKEESNLDVIDFSLILEEEFDWNWCSRGVKVHYWYLYRVVVSHTDFTPDRESKKMGWYSPEDMKRLAFEPAWEYAYKLLKIIK